MSVSFTFSVARVLGLLEEALRDAAAVDGAEQAILVRQLLFSRVYFLFIDLFCKYFIFKSWRAQLSSQLWRCVRGHGHACS